MIATPLMHFLGDTVKDTDLIMVDGIHRYLRSCRRFRLRVWRCRPVRMPDHER